MVWPRGRYLNSLTAMGSAMSQGAATVLNDSRLTIGGFYEVPSTGEFRRKWHCTGTATWLSFFPLKLFKNIILAWIFISFADSRFCCGFVVGFIALGKNEIIKKTNFLRIISM